MRGRGPRGIRPRRAGAGLGHRSPVPPSRPLHGRAARLRPGGAAAPLGRRASPSGTASAPRASASPQARDGPALAHGPRRRPPGGRAASRSSARCSAASSPTSSPADARRVAFLAAVRAEVAERHATLRAARSGVSRAQPEGEPGRAARPARRLLGRPRRSSASTAWPASATRRLDRGGGIRAPARARSRFLWRVRHESHLAAGRARATSSPWTCSRSWPGCWATGPRAACSPPRSSCASTTTARRRSTSSRALPAPPPRAASSASARLGLVRGRRRSGREASSARRAPACAAGPAPAGGAGATPRTRTSRVPGAHARHALASETGRTARSAPPRDDERAAAASPAPPRTRGAGAARRCTRRACSAA